MKSQARLSYSVSMPGSCSQNQKETKTYIAASHHGKLDRKLIGTTLIQIRCRIAKCANMKNKVPEVTMYSRTLRSTLADPKSIKE